MRLQRLLPIPAALLVALLSLSSCSLFPGHVGNETGSTLTPPPRPAVRRVVQFDLGRVARFAQCVEPNCPSPTRKTLAVVAAAIRPAMAPLPASDSSQPEAAPSIPSSFPNPAPQEVKTQVLTLLFATDSAALSHSHRSQLAKVATALSRAERILIVGRTDNVGPARANESIALARASKVRDHLIRVLPHQPGDIRIDARGLCCYAAPNDTKEGRARNRRVEVVFTPSLEAAP